MNKLITSLKYTELRHWAELAKKDWIGKITGGTSDIAYFEGGHKVVRNDDINCYDTAKYISTAEPEVILMLLDRLEELEKEVAVKKRPKPQFPDLELTDEDMW